MNTPTHLLVALAALAKKDQRAVNLSVAFGALLPDLPVFLWAPWQFLVNGESGDRVWRELYFEPPMQLLIAPFNSIPIILAFSLLGFWKRTKLWGKCLLGAGLAMLLHIALDIPFHGHDAYRNFWPISEWRYYSPLSYWEADNFAGYVVWLEIFIGALSIFLLWRRFPKLWVKIALVICTLLYVLLAAMYVLPNFGPGG